MSRSSFGRFFRNPGTGELTLVQLPNVPLATFLAATAARLAFHPQGDAGTAASVVSGLSIVWWSVDEIVRGDSRFRRVLGGVVLVGVAFGLIMR